MEKENAWIEWHGAGKCPNGLRDKKVEVVFRNGMKRVGMVQKYCWSYEDINPFYHDYDIVKYRVIDGEEITTTQEELELIKKEESSHLATQIGGKHYKGCKIQPIEYIVANGLGYTEGNVIKYVTRHKEKNKAEDIKKAIHYLQLLLELEYGMTVKENE